MLLCIWQKVGDTMERYIVKKGKRLRYGYTTGTCAAACSKAAVYMLFSGEIIDKVEVDTPKGWKVTIDVKNYHVDRDSVCCEVIKDAGDDPDITDGLSIVCKAERISTKGIEIQTCEGIGIVTRPGLQVPPGEPAINPVPMAMIRREVSKVLPQNLGVKLTLSIPKGKEIAKRTFNPRLGIKGGLSILGTSGIVEPMSCEALKDTLTAELSVLAAKGMEEVILVPGNYGKNFALKQGLNEDKMISYGNFLGHVLEKSLEFKFKKIILIGDIGKLVKVSAGIFDTTGRVADARREILAAYAGYFGAKRDVIGDILFSTTTEDALEILEKANININKICKFTAERIVDKCRWYTFDKIDFKVFLISHKRGLLAMAK